MKGELAARRQGTSSTKTRGMVAGGRAKPWRQKGTGRARAGTTRAPQWTGGGVAFGPQPRSYTGKVNRKARVKALRIALSSHALAGSLHVVDGDTFDAPKTSHAAELTRGAELHTPLVVVVGGDELAPGQVVPQSAPHPRRRRARARGGRGGVGTLAGRLEGGPAGARGR